MTPARLAEIRLAVLSAYSDRTDPITIQQRADFLELLDTAERERWIPVGERMPRPGEDVLIWVVRPPCDMDPEESTFPALGQLVVLPATAGSRSWWSTDENTYRPDEVTHWKPEPREPQ